MKLADDEREVILAEVEELLQRASQPKSRQRYAALRDALQLGELPDGFVPDVERLVEIGLESGRIRQVHSAHGEMAALRFYRRSSRARPVQASLEAVSQALSGLAGQTLEEITLSLAGPGSFTLAISTDQGRLLVQLDRGGAEVRSVEVG